MTIGDYICTVRKEAGLSQGRLASMAGVSQSSISDIESNSRELSLSVFISLCKALSISPSKVIAAVYEGDVTALVDPSNLLTQFHSLTEEEVSLLNSLIYLLPSQQRTRATSWVKGVAAAGAPLFDANYTEDEAITINPKYVDNSRFIIIKVKGDSMSPKIQDGDHVVVQRFLEPFRGDICLIRFTASAGEDEYAIKRYFPDRDSVKLVSINPDYPPMKIKSSDLRSVEKVVDIIRSE